MSSFKGAEICQVESVVKHPNADALEIVKLKGKDYTCVVQTSMNWSDGCLGVYIPEQAVIPDTILERIGLKGKLAGSKGNRVKAVKLRGVISQGLFLPLEDLVGEDEFNRMAAYGEMPNEGEDISEMLGIYKYEPPIPTSMSGDVLNLYGHTVKYDIENIKNHPGVFEDGEEVTITEKLHGTLVCFSYHPNMDNPELFNNNVAIYSKGLGAKGLVFKWNPKNENLLYHRAFKTVESKFQRMTKAWKMLQPDKPIFLFGEVFGTGVQDLNYGSKEPVVRFFDIFAGDPDSGNWVDNFEKKNFFTSMELPQVPILYNGPFSDEIVQYYTSEYNDGKETFSTKSVNVREGIVITPAEERKHPSLGRVILKSVNPNYLTRKGGTEYN